MKIKIVFKITDVMMPHLILLGLLISFLLAVTWKVIMLKDVSVPKTCLEERGQWRLARGALIKHALVNLLQKCFYLVKNDEAKTICLRI